jgi:ribonucleoside-diphosphate reductase alpha chain
MDCIGTNVSVALQYGVPVSSLVNKFTYQRFEPAGMTSNPDIPFAKSMVDYIFRWMGMQFIPGYREANAPKREPAPQVNVTMPEAIAMLSGVGDAEVGSADLLAADSATVLTPPLFGDGGTPAGGQSPTSGGGVAAASVPHVHVHRTVTVTETDIDVTGLPARTMGAIAMEKQGDGPACEKCGTITVRNGTCYKCLNCGNSLGCS